MLALAAALLTGGCGGGGGGESFAADANRACQERIDRLDAVIRDADRPGADADIAEAYEDELAQLRALEPPEDSAADFRRMLDLYAAGARAQDRYARLRAEAERARDRDIYNTALDRASRENTASRRARSQGNNLARDIGLETCATALY